MYNWNDLIFLSIGLRLDTDKKTERWRTRTASQLKRRKKWTQPLLSDEASSAKNKLKGWSPIKNLSTPEYIIGNSTVNSLENTKVRLGHYLGSEIPTSSEVFELADTGRQIHEMEDTHVRRHSQSPKRSISNASSDIYN